ncbi:hypothetical protein HPP92_010570 [Vanilla planifolia]|uniref:Paladin n=1 Tax=Vanilla planifolia TaxID=51239 RepID=A0A835R5G1_VANPL|nr:hypothetical protein HPP92_010570 [Vanilla planifolia]
MIQSMMNYRGGSVLKKTILKSDHFPAAVNKRPLRRLKFLVHRGDLYVAVCLQRVHAVLVARLDHYPVHGVAIPTINGIRNVLIHIGADRIERKKILWHNLRKNQEVVICLEEIFRDALGPHRAAKRGKKVNCSKGKLESIMKQRVYNGGVVRRLKVYSFDKLEVYDYFGFHVYQELQIEGYYVDYERVPITDEKSPKERDFDDLMYRISQTDRDTEYVFNCQMGRGRTTTGMVIATLVYLNRIGASGIQGRFNWKIFSTGVDITDNMPNSEEAARRGDYAVIRSLIRVLEGGVEGKRQVDKVIDKCDAMQNLREAISNYGNNILRQPDEKEKEASLSCFVEYLERYYFLICFAVYIHTERAALHDISSEKKTFSEWMRARPELYSILRRLLRRNPMGALVFYNRNNL